MLRWFVDFFNAYDQYHLRGMLRNPLTTELFAALMHNNACLLHDSNTHLRDHETSLQLVRRLSLANKNKPL
ncbi:hypothetical protein, partial [Escherichia coli]|uniref:hypothetical protein n=1 Tax=Escherichia coli TaxID=562 RepID=UPI001BECAD81